MVRRLALTVAGVLLCAAAQAAVIHVNAQDNTFSPQIISASSGDSIVWTNTGTVAHTVTSSKPATPGRLFDQNLAPGQTFTWLVPNVPRAIRLQYLCRFHAAVGMKGAIDLSP